MARATPRTAPPPSAAITAAASTHPAVEGLDRFLSHISHELRTPLSAIMLWTRLLDQRDGRSAVDVGEAVEAIRSSAEELQRLIENLVDTSRVISGKVSLEVNEVIFAELLEESLKTVEPVAEERNIRVTQVGEMPACVLLGDRRRLGQVVRNLLQHAVETSPPGTEVRLSARAQGTEFELSVADSGPGLPIDLASHVFDHFGLAAGTEESPASGVALAVVRRLVELHEGRIRAQSGPGPGTTFFVTLPARIEAVAEPRTAAPIGGDVEAVAPAPRSLQGVRILLIEDAAETRKALNLILSEAGAIVTAVDSSSGALGAFKANPIDLVVSDLGLPKMDGYELMMQFRRWERLDSKRPVPALALTAFAGEGTRRRAAQSGYNDCLTKPVDPFRLIEALAKLAGRPT